MCALSVLDDACLTKLMVESLLEGSLYIHFTRITTFMAWDLQLLYYAVGMYTIQSCTLHSLKLQYCMNCSSLCCCSVAHSNAAENRGEKCGTCTGILQDPIIIQHYW